MANDVAKYQQLVDALCIVRRGWRSPNDRMRYDAAYKLLAEHTDSLCVDNTERAALKDASLILSKLGYHTIAKGIEIIIADMGQRIDK